VTVEFGVPAKNSGETQLIVTASFFVLGANTYYRLWSAHEVIRITTQHEFLTDEKTGLPP